MLKRSLSYVAGCIVVGVLLFRIGDSFREHVGFRERMAQRNSTFDGSETVVRTQSGKVVRV